MVSTGRGSGIVHLDYYLPSTSLPLAEVVARGNQAQHRWTPDELAQRIAYIREMSCCRSVLVEEDNSPLSVLDGLLERFLESSGIDPAKVVAVFHTDIHNFRQGDVNIPYFLQHKYGMRNATIISVNQQCAGALFGVIMGGKLLSQVAEEYVVILSSCFIGPVEHRFLGDCVAGDGAGIIVLGSRGGFCRVLSGPMRALGDASYNRFFGRPVTVSSVNMLKGISQMISGMLAEHGASDETVSQYILQNTNSYLFTTLLSRMLRCDEAKMFSANYVDGGHLGDVDIIRNLKDYLDLARPDIGPHVALCTVGSFGYEESDRVMASVLVELSPD